MSFVEEGKNTTFENFLMRMDEQKAKAHELVDQMTEAELSEKVDIALVDLSFISIRLVLKNIFDLVKPDGKVIALIKHQFEVGQTGLDSNGIVKSEGHRLVMLHELKEWCKAHGFIIADQCDSPILGKNGNKEYFFYFDKGHS